MRVGAAFLCDSAETREGLLFVLGAGVSRIWRPDMPAPMGVCLGMIIELHRDERDRPHEFEVRIHSEDGQEIAKAAGGFQVDAEGSDLEVHEMATVPIALDFRSVPLPAFGPYSVEITINGEHRRSLGFSVRPVADRPRIGVVPPN
jgi:predicted dienelactone hydrolase